MSIGETPARPAAGGGTVRSGRPVTVGVLILVPDPLGGRVRRLRERFSDDLVAIPTHVTLVPPMPVLEDALPCVVDHLGRVASAVAPFEIRLSGSDTFQPVTDVVYLRLVDGLRECDELQRRMRTGPLAGRLRFPYHPHVTLAHDVPQSALDTARAEMAAVEERFFVERFVLFVDRSDGDWEPVREFVLGGDRVSPSVAGAG